MQSRLRSALVLISAVVAAFPAPASAWSSKASQTLYQIKFSEGRIGEFHQDQGRYPGQKEYAGIISESSGPTGRDPWLDSWHRPVIYRMPGRHGRYDLYSTGADGIDSDGMGDDISNWRGVNDGYHWKRWWPWGRRVLGLTAGITAALLILRCVRPWPPALPLAGFIAGVGMAIGSLLLKHPGVAPSRNAPLSIASMAGILLIILSLRELRFVLPPRHPRER